MPFLIPQDYDSPSADVPEDVSEVMKYADHCAREWLLCQEWLRINGQEWLEEGRFREFVETRLTDAPDATDSPSAIPVVSPPS